MRNRFFFFSFLSICFISVFGQGPEWMYDGPPVFHGAKIVGNYPGTDFLFTVPATGQRPITFFSRNLPKGLNMEATTGIIRGKVLEPGTYEVTIIAANAYGRAEENLKIVIGDQLCLTPPMGWNSWNVFTNTLDEKLVMAMADAMVENGMRDLGYQYINMDDFWHAASRDSSGRPVANPKKFPHGIRWLADYVHARGLKLGIYSDAGDKTCGGCFGGFQHEDIDAKTYSEWGIDLLKYDFCHVPWKKKIAIARYQKMGDALRHSDRSIVYSICNWGLFKPWKWAAKTGGNYWRTTPDIFDVWNHTPLWTSSVMHILRRQNKLADYAGPGHWNDPDMMIVGNYGKGKATSHGGRFKGLTDMEYQTQMSLWCMMAAPLLSSCDLRHIDSSTKNILTNPYILAINQDALGEQGRVVEKRNSVWVYLKHLQDGSIALAIFNKGNREKTFALKSASLGLEGSYSAFDVWQKRETGIFNDSMKLALHAHQTVVLLLKAAK